MFVYCNIQLIVSVRPSNYNPTSNFPVGDNHNTSGSGGGSDSLDDATKQVLKVSNSYMYVLVVQIAFIQSG